MAEPVPIFLVGMMGSGKSTVGRVLAQRLGRPFVDLDAELERRAGKDVPTIFGEEGEAGFRARERATLSAVLATTARSGPVIATGGGVVCDDLNVEAMAAAGVRVYLRVPLEVLAKRLCGPESEARPLLSGDGAGAEEALRYLMNRRRARYEACDIIVDGQAPPNVVAETIQRAVAERVRDEPDEQR